MSNYSKYFVLERQLNNAGYTIEREDAIAQLTGGRKTSMQNLTGREYQALIAMMKKAVSSLEDPSLNRMRRKIIALFRKMGYEKRGKADMRAIYSWVKKYSTCHKGLNDHSVPEMVTLVSQVKRVYDSYLGRIHR